MNLYAVAPSPLTSDEQLVSAATFALVQPVRTQLRDLRASALPNVRVFILNSAITSVPRPRR
jgi:hypothetical protein